MMKKKQQNKKIIQRRHTLESISIHCSYLWDVCFFFHSEAIAWWVVRKNEDILIENQHHLAERNENKKWLICVNNLNWSPSVPQPLWTSLRDSKLRQKKFVKSTTQINSTSFYSLLFPPTHTNRCRNICIWIEWTRTNKRADNQAARGLIKGL